MYENILASHLDPLANGHCPLARGFHWTGNNILDRIVNFGNSIGQLCPLSSHHSGHKIENKHKQSKSETRQKKDWKVKK